MQQTLDLNQCHRNWKKIFYPSTNFKPYSMCWGEVMAGHMGRGVIEEQVWRKGPWTAEGDKLLVEYVRLHGEGRWNSVARLASKKHQTFFTVLFLNIYDWIFTFISDNIAKKQLKLFSTSTVHSGYIHVHRKLFILKIILLSGRNYDMIYVSIVLVNLYVIRS